MPDFKLNALSPTIVTQIKDYLKQSTEVEEGGFLLGKRELINDSVVVSIDEFIPVRNNYSAYKIDKSSFLPTQEIGYYPDPQDYVNVLQRTKSLDPTSNLMIVGFVHSHPHWEAFPSRYDLTHVSRTYGYVMAIYSNPRDHIRFWYVLQDEENKKWSKGSLSLAAVELAVTL